MQVNVSVVMISYNHEDFIEEALLSILEQECNFNFEIIISDDNSKDATKEHIERIINTHPRGNLIRFFSQNPNLGMMKNFGFVLQEAKGDYIAICEGDDYWTDSKKLQKQYDVLEGNSDRLTSVRHNLLPF